MPYINGYLNGYLGFGEALMAFSAQERTDRWVKNLATNVNPHKKFANFLCGFTFVARFFTHRSVRSCAENAIKASPKPK